MHKINILIFPIVLFAAIAAVWLFAKPLFSEAQRLKNVKKPELERLVQQENSLQERTAKIANEEAGGDQLKIIKSALPPKKEIKSLIAQIEFIAKKDKITLASISAEDNSKESDLTPSALSSSNSSGYRAIRGTVEVKGGYNQLKQLIKNLRQLDRIVNVRRVSINNVGNDESGSSTGKYSLEFLVYWQPEISAELIKTGLENLEFGINSNASAVNP